MKKIEFDIHKLTEILDKYSVSCPICKQTKFTGELEPQSLNTIDVEKKTVVTGSGYVLAIISCDNCGLVIPFRASKLQQ